MPRYPFDQCFIITHFDKTSGTPDNSIVNMLALKHEIDAMINPDELSDMSSYAHIIESPSSMSRPDMAALISHVGVWQKIVDRNLDSALILEDTAVTNFDASSLNTKLLEFYSVYNDKFDILYLGKCQDSCGHYKKAYDGVYKSRRPLCKYAYIITKDCAQKLLSRLPTAVATDVFLSQAIADGLRAFVFHPSIIRRNDLDLFEDHDDKSRAWKESVFRETMECKYEPEPESQNWIPIAVIIGIAVVIIILIALSRR